MAFPVGLLSETLNKIAYGDGNDYDARQTRFQKYSSEIVDDLAKGFDEPNPKPFRSLIGELALKRQNIAIEEGTPGAYLFGTEIRDNIEVGNHTFTPLARMYQEVGERAIKDLGVVLNKMKHSVEEFTQKTLKMEEGVDGRQFSTTYEYLDPKDVQKWQADPPFEAYIAKFQEKIKQEERKPAGDVNLSEDIKKSRQGYQRYRLFKEMFPDCYKHARMQVFLELFNKNFPSPQSKLGTNEVESGHPENAKSDYLLVTMRTQIPDKEGVPKMVATNQLLTCLHRDLKEDPVERMVRLQSPVAVLHQDTFLNQMSLNECAKIFDEILSLKKTAPLKELKEKIALLRYLFAQAMPYIRGSAAIAEWLEMALYKRFGYQCSYQRQFTKDCADTAALGSLSYSIYLDRYNKLVQLEKIPF